MITLEAWMKANKYVINDSETFEWDCYGDNARIITCWDATIADAYESSIIVDVKSNVVYEVTVCDYNKKQAYRLINPDWKDAQHAEAIRRNNESNTSVNYDVAWDDVTYTDLEIDSDFIEKLEAICDEKSYDERIAIPLEFSKDELYNLMLAAHMKDMTLNQFITWALREVINQSSLPNVQTQTQVESN